ncbi:lytic transglycosylase domain-containing protein [Roseibacterium sp. SDUM158016]|uniref:lytic transglycosylase domain-containing protein n=1 Tax=Roseicyclus sediminis TaxID=2980997 RepID=UPI0021CF5C4B|nr:lytic transglycosylase domain-containing protein [Roseibacterium sp. SDUM158016]MCU4655128.1 lytic transglycosylase domain-containing protein [Roseibacterium sp. SDUM158016]
MKQRYACVTALALALVTVSVVPRPASGQDEGGHAFRRITAPGADHVGPRITIQIRPGDNFQTPGPDGAVARPATPPAGPGSDSASASAEGQLAAPGDVASWFWSAVSPAMPASAARYWTAQALLEQGPDEAQAVTPRLAHVAGLAETYGRELLMATVGTSISPAFALAIISVESAGRQDAVSHAGAQGLMQLIPATAERFGVANPFDPAENIRGGVAYLDWLMEEFDRDPVLVLAAYNAGEGAVRRSGGVPDFDETRNYVPRVLAAWQVTRRLCRTPPDLVSDGCVFQPIAVE